MRRTMFYLTSLVLILGLAGSAGAALGDKGNILFEWFDATTGGNLNEAVDGRNANYPDNPSQVEYRTVLQGPTTRGDNYMTHVRGYVYPPETGDYTFWTSGDDHNRLWLSTDADPANKVLIAEVDGYTGAAQWDKYPSQKSAPITLQAGQKYYIELLHREGGGGDNLAVGWGGPVIGVGPVVIDGAFLSPWLVHSARMPKPAVGAIDVDVAALEWTAGDLAVSHKVYLSADATIDAADLVGEPTAPVTLQVVTVEPGVTYYWRVDAVEADQTMVQGLVWSFTTLPREAHFPSPADGAINVLNPELKWTGGKNAILHNVYFGTDPAALPPVSMMQPVASYKAPALENGKVYYWRVDEFAPPGGVVAGPVWSFSTPPVIPVSDPNLVGWWKSEVGEEGAPVVLDWSGHGNHGTIVPGSAGTVLRVPTLFDQGLEFLGDNLGHVELPPGIVTTAKGSILMWINTTQGNAANNDEGMLWWASQTDGDGYGGQNEMHLNIDDPTEGELDFFLEEDASGTSDITLNGPLVGGTGWRHVAATWDLTDGVRMYVDGVQVRSAAHNTNVKSFAVMRLGRPVGTGSGNCFYDGLMDDVRLFNYAISAERLAAIAAVGEDPLRANIPNPANGATVSYLGARPLTWSAGEGATQHDVYFGDDLAAVTNADTTTAGIYIGRQAETSYDPGLLEWGKTFYWRVDEISGTDPTPRKGYIWSLNITATVLIDGFESYDVLPVAPDPAGLVASFTFEGNANDSVGGHNGTLNGGATFAAGKVGQALSLDGIDDLVVVGPVGISGAAARTISGWAKVSATTWPSWINVFGFTGPSGNDGHFDIELVGNSGTVATLGWYGLHVYGWERNILKADAEWHHLAATYDGTTIKWYGDGVRIGADSTRVLNTPDNVHMGKRVDQTTYFPGLVDEVQISGRVLSEAEIAGMAGFVPTAPIGNTWVASGTAIAVLAFDQPHGGAKAMTIQYQNGVAPHMGEVSVVPSITDMTQGAGSLVIWVRGDPNNGADPIYVALQDSAGASAVVVHSDPLAAQDGNWAAWIIPLNKFAGMNLASVAKLSIGVGNGQPGGAGAIRIDDIMLVKPAIITQPADVTASGDFVRGIPNDGDWPGGQAPAMAIDNNVTTKFLHRKGDVGPSGIQVTPLATQTIVTGLTLTTANDFAGRDPIVFELSGSNVGINGPYELIAAGPIVDFNQPTEWPRRTMNATPISFDNAVAYDHYQLIFAAIRGPVSADVNHMQIAEVELIGISASAVVAKPKIIWVSDNKTPAAGTGVPADQAWVDLLSAQGYDVDLSFRNKEGRTLDDAKIAALNAADLIIISRDTNSGDYDDGQEVTQWNSLTTPVLMQVAQIAQSSRWRWINIGTTNNAQPATLQAVATTHPIFSGVTLDASNQVGVITTNVSFVSTADAGNGTLIASRADNGQVWIVEWQAGLAFYASSTQTPAGHRLLFCSGGTGGVSDGTYNLTAEGEKMFLNAVAYMLQ